MLQVCVTSGPNKPADIFSFLEPFLTEVHELSESGMIVRIGSDTLKVKGHLMFVGGDIPAVAKMCGHAGHNHYHGCRFCTIRGNGRDEAQADHQPKASIRLSQTFQISDQCLGQQKASPFVTLSSFHGATFFLVDPMHLLGPGIGKQLWRLILGDYGESANPFYLLPKNRQLIGARIAASRSLIPSSFAGDCGDVATQSGFYRAVDWIHFVRFFVPTIVLEFYTDPGVRKAIIDLSEIYCYALSRELSVNQIRSLKVTVFSWTA
ncbi:uncharacterized protein BYT42DRAFT_498503 [Radiomyces spectabilis]|uniref:uncharacterized protein n=1 Tax=Radiomyces spectabilis TaxID=64574 RepID=UPI00221F5745|nr:uncharacterized protein BYT42DRAFT_498760 [Radiomyces spectabilis]XP_051422702.1 uncharacterized protein BYT42DRAFT_498503 [Radiomyces spectabilis]KAI8376571.1 hypothetical protein BYT42DRAFT_498760 [Radiomyces spectabilis]KAI8376577.1 hypothetical protein BYT42DRAFT_498503 [Radiomyces spectabilis]